MKNLLLVSIVMIILGVVALTYQGITYTTTEKAIDIGPLQITAERTHTIPLRMLETKYRPEHIFHILRKLSSTSLDILDDFPGDIRILWKRLQRGEINIPIQHNIDAKGIEPLRKTLNTTFNRLGNAILTAAVLITSSNLIASDLSPKIWGIPALGLIGLVWGVWMCFRHALSTRRSDGL